VLDAGEVHRAALATHQPVGAAQQLGEYRRHGHAPGQGVCVTTVGGEGVVVGVHGRAEAGGDGLHAEGQVGGSLDQLAHEEVVRALLELAHLLKHPVHAEALVEVDVGAVVPILRLRRQHDAVLAVAVLRQRESHAPRSAAARRVLMCDWLSRSVLRYPPAV
jgi:hypothetical protein